MVLIDEDNDEKLVENFVLIEEILSNYLFENIEIVE
jgi:hypothetical protein